MSEPDPKFPNFVVPPNAEGLLHEWQKLQRSVYPGPLSGRTATEAVFRADEQKREARQLAEAQYRARLTVLNLNHADRRFLKSLKIAV